MIGTGDRDRGVRILEDIVLSTITEVVEVSVEGWGKGAFIHVVLFLLEPVEGALGTVSAVSGGSVRDTVSGVSTAPTRELCFGQRDIRGRSSDVTLETGHIILLTTTVGRVNPEPRAVTPSWGTRRHVLWDLEIREPGPHAGLVHAEDDKVLRFDSRNIGLVGDGKSTSGQIIETGSVNGSQG